MFSSLAAIPLMMLQASSSMPRVPQCAVARATVFVDRFADLPTQIRDDVLLSGKIAELNEPFNETDLIDDPAWPNRRFIRAGYSGNRWFVWIEHGGFNHHYDVLGYGQLWEKADSWRWYRTAELQGDSCVAINAFLAGVWTPKQGVH